MESEEPKTMAEEKPRKRIVMKRNSFSIKRNTVKIKKEISNQETDGDLFSNNVSEAEPVEEKQEQASELSAVVSSEVAKIQKKRGRKPKIRPVESEKVQTLLQSGSDAESEKPVVNAEPQTESQKEEKREDENTSDQTQRQDRKPFPGKHDRQDRPQKGQKFQNQNRKPLSLEEISIPGEEYREHLKNRIIIGDLSLMNTVQLKEKYCCMTGKTEDDYIELKKQEVIAEILRSHSASGGVIYSIGTLEVLSEGYGFLRSAINSYLSGPEDVYVSPAQIKFLNLRTGDTIEGQIRTPKENERFFAISRIAFINGDAPVVAKTRTSFDSLVPLYPDKRINLETERTDNDVSMRIINLFCPIGKGQRALITAPPRTGKTILLQQIANSITANHPEIKLIVLLVDERPEEVTDMRRNVKGEVIASTFDEQATRHVQVAEMVIEKAKRLVEHRHDVVILLDSITRLARAYNQTVPASGKILSGGVDSNALHKPKRFFGAARNIEGGGSLTIIASALIETGSRMDEVIFEEFKGTGNSEIVLDRRMADMRLFPAMNLKKSGTRRDDLLLSELEAARVWALRNAFSMLDDVEMTQSLVDKMRKTKNNESFLRSMNTGIAPVS